MQNLMIWPIAFPMIAGMICFAFQKQARSLVLLIVPSIVWIIFYLAIYSWDQVISYPIGGWGAPLGIELYVDRLTIAMLVMTTTVGSLITLYAWGYLEKQRELGKTFWPVWFILWGSLHALFLAQDIFNLYITLELLTLTAVSLVASSGTKNALNSGLRYLFAALLGSLFYLLGVVLLYRRWGSLDIYYLAQIIQMDSLTGVALCLITGGLVMKAALFPMHFWLPSAHASVLAPVSAILSGLVIKGPFYILWRLYSEVFFPILNPTFINILGFLGGCAVLWGGVQALVQRDLKHLIAYSTVSQIGYFVLALAIAARSSDMYTSVLYFVLAHAIAKSGMFLLAGNVSWYCGSHSLEDVTKVSSVQPSFILAFAVLGMTIMGMPPAVSFFAKWQLLSFCLEEKLLGYVFVIVLGGLLAAAYVLKVLQQGFLTSESESHELLQEQLPWQMAFIPWLLVVLSIVFALLMPLMNQVFE